MKAKKNVKELLEFIDRAPTPYHAVAELSAMLDAAGGKKLDESERWDVLEPEKLYYFVRNESCIAAFKTPSEEKKAAGWNISLSHIDYPCLRVRPKPCSESNSYMRLNVEIYGGAIIHSWFDRPLGLAGRVYVKDDSETGFHGVNIHVKEPLLVIPELAIHMNGGVNDNAHFNPQTEMLPFFSQRFGDNDSFEKYIAKKAGVKAENIISYDLSVCEYAPSVLTGRNGEFISAPHLDNTEMAYCSFKGFIDACSNAENFSGTGSLVIAFDNEEVGSKSDRGAGSELLLSTLSRISSNLGLDQEDNRRALVNSVICSADMAHAAHPSYPSTYDGEHVVYLNKGPVLKHSYSQKYIESPKGAAIFKSICEKAAIPYQEFVNRNDLRGGSTVGPTSSSAIGATGFDIGNAIFSMHSVREFGGSGDVEPAVNFFRVFHS